jgi:hypothetical protein
MILSFLILSFLILSFCVTVQLTGEVALKNVIANEVKQSQFLR